MQVGIRITSIFIFYFVVSVGFAYYFVGSTFRLCIVVYYKFMINISIYQKATIAIACVATMTEYYILKTNQNVINECLYVFKGKDLWSNKCLQVLW